MSFLSKFRLPVFFATIIAAIVVVFACTGEGRAKDKPHYVFKEGQGPAGAMASIDGKPVTLDELIGDQRVEYAEAAKKVYDIQLDGIGHVLLDRVYGEKAKAANMGLDEYIEKKVLTGDVKISDSDYKKFVADKHIPKEQINDQLRERIMNYMKAQKKMEQLTVLIASESKTHKVEVYFPKPSLKVNVEVGQAPVFGSRNAKVTIVEFSDFQCPFCGRAATTVNEIKKAYGNKILLAFKNYPLPMHPNAKPAAEASMCVFEQNSDKYWKYQDKLFANQEKLDGDNLKKYATEVGANADQYSKCVAEHKYAKQIQEDMDYGNKLGVRSTPTFFINGRLLSGAQPIESFKEIIDDEMNGG